MSPSLLVAYALFGLLAFWVAGRAVLHAVRGVAQVLATADDGLTRSRLAVAGMAGILMGTAAVLMGAFIVRLLPQ